MIPRSQLAYTLVVALGLTACKRHRGDAPEAVQAYVTAALPAARQSLDVMKAAAQQVVAMAPLTQDSSYGGAPISAKCEDVALLAIDFHIPTNVPGSTLDTPNRWSGVVDVIGGRQRRFDSVAEAKSAFDALAAVKYVLILKTLSRQDPAVTSTTAHGAFVPGHVAGEAHLFSLDATPRHLGGFRWRATNGASIAVSAAQKELYEKAKREAQGDLAAQVKAAITDGAKTFGAGRLTLVF